MKLINNNCSSISAQLDITDLSEYVVARIKVFLNCCNKSEYFIQIDDLQNTLPEDAVYLEGNTFILNSEFFEDELVDSIYTIEITLYEDNGSSYGDTGCLFVDCTTKCRVYEKIKEMTDDQEKTQLLMEHYSLTVGSNCSCDCDNLCEIYNSLMSKLEGIESDCGCV